MTKHAFNEAFVATQPAAADAVSQAVETYSVMVALSVTDITARSLDRTRVVHLVRGAQYDVYHYDPDNVEAEDGVNVILDSDDRPFVRRPTGSGALTAHKAGSFAGRDAFDGEASPRADGGLFIYLSTDGDGGSIADAVLFAKLDDGANWSDPIEIRGPRGGDRYEISNWDSDRPASGEEVIAHLFTTDAVFPAGLTGSIASAQAAATGTAVYAISKNGAPVGSLTFDASATGVFALAAQTAFAAGDRFSVTAPDPRDATLSGVAMTFVATR